MSASPAGPPSGPASTTPSGNGPAPPRRRRQPANPFMAKSKPVRKVAPGATNGASNTSGAGPSQPNRPATKPAPVAPDPDDDSSTYDRYDLIASTKAELESRRFHAMRFTADEEVNPWNPAQFTPPLRLHRRFPRDIMTRPVEGNGVDDKDREKEEIRRAERQAQREADQAQIAPTGKQEQKKKQGPQGKKVQDVYYPTDTPEAQKRMRLRYEEGRPWHLEDFDGKNTWVGKYEEPLSETCVMLVLSDDGRFRMVPIEKWYRMGAANRYKTMDLDEAEKHMSKKVKDSRWAFEKEQGGEEKRRAHMQRQRNLGRGRVGERGERQVKDEDDYGDMPDVADDVDEIDFEAEDEFQDDDEGKLFGGDDDEARESERRVRQEMLGANIFAGTGVKEEKDWDAEEEKEKKKEREEKRRQKKLRKALIRSEKKYEYDDDSEANPYSSESESEDSEEERQKEEEERKKEEEKLKLNGEKGVGGTSTGGSNTPSGRPEKHGDGRSSLGASLKRPGSPNLSEASGSESTRKKLKRDANGGPTSRPMSPANAGGVRAMSPSTRIRGGAGSGSDTEASGTERGKRKVKLSRPGSPNAGSPTASAPGSRPGSPPPAAVALPSAEEVRAAIPDAGITIRELIAKFRNQIPRGSTDASQAFIRLVRQVGKYSQEDKTLIIPK